METANNADGIGATTTQQYGDTKRASEYSTENYKMELLNLPKWPKFGALKNLLERRFKVNPHKIRIGKNNAFLAFKDERERDDAIAKLNNQQLKGKTLVAKAASARDDSMVDKRRPQIDGRSDDTSSADADKTITHEEINERICPLLTKTYEEQLVFKDSLVRSVLKMSKQIQKMSPTLKTDDPKLYRWTVKHKEIACNFDGVVPSPVLKGYRNKCEFSISHDGIIGFKIGRYRNGSDRVCRPPEDCPLLTGVMFKIIDVFEQYLKSVSTLKGFDMVTHEGHYRQITIRCNSNDEYLLIIDLNPQGLPEEELEREFVKAVDTLKSIEQIISIYFNVSSKNSFSSAHQSLRLAYGQECLYEELFVDIERPLKFRVGPGSFFQVNSKAAELLYRSIIEVAGLGPNSMVLDVGCGTGTISLSLASKVNHVIGIEIVPEAIRDAKENALNNKIDNVSFYAGKAEDLIGESITILKNKLEYQKIDGDIVAIVDPPRAGFTNSFIKTIRASNIKRIIYIACDPKANTNLLALCRPTSKAYQGEPFVPVRAKAFDLFPHTTCCELMVVYERLSMLDEETRIVEEILL
jgi:tRNA (uracil-5-)-methyltransferase